MAFMMAGELFAIVVWAGERPIAGPVGVVASLIMLPSIAERCVMLKVPASCASETVGVVRPSGVSTAVSMLSPSSMLMSWIPTVDCISAALPPAISGSPDSSETMLSPLGSSGSPDVEAWCRMDGLLLERPVGTAVFVGRTAGDRNCAGGSGVVGDSGCDVNPLWKPGTIEGRRSISRTGRMLKPSVASIEGTAVTSGWIG